MPGSTSSSETRGHDSVPLVSFFGYDELMASGPIEGTPMPEESSEKKGIFSRFKKMADKVTGAFKQEGKLNPQRLISQIPFPQRSKDFVHKIRQKFSGEQNVEVETGQVTDPEATSSSESSQGPSVRERATGWLQEKLHRQENEQNPEELAAEVQAELATVQEEAVNNRQQILSVIQEIVDRFEGDEELTEDSSEYARLDQILRELSMVHTNLNARLVKLEAMAARIDQIVYFYQQAPDHPGAREVAINLLEQLRTDLDKLSPPSRKDRLVSWVKEGFATTGEASKETVKDLNFWISAAMTGGLITTRVLLSPAYIVAAPAIGGAKLINDELRLRRNVNQDQAQEYLQRQVAVRTNKDALREPEENLPRWKKALRGAINAVPNTFMFFENLGIKVALGQDEARQRVINELENQPEEQTNTNEQEQTEVQLNLEQFRAWLDGQLNQFQQAVQAPEPDVSEIRSILRSLDKMQRDLIDLDMLGKYSPSGFGRHNIEVVTPELAQAMKDEFQVQLGKEEILIILQSLVEVGGRVGRLAIKILERFAPDYEDKRAVNLSRRISRVSAVTTIMKGTIFAYGGEASQTIFGHRPQMDVPSQPVNRSQGQDLGDKVKAGMFNPQDNPPTPRVEVPDLGDKVEAGVFNPDVNDVLEAKVNPTLEAMTRAAQVPEGFNPTTMVGWQDEVDYLPHFDTPEGFDHGLLHLDGVFFERDLGVLYQGMVDNVAKSVVESAQLESMVANSGIDQEGLAKLLALINQTPGVYQEAIRKGLEGFSPHDVQKMIEFLANPDNKDTKLWETVQRVFNSAYSPNQNNLALLDRRNIWNAFNPDNKLQTE